nr:N-acetylneuraminate synthase [uncultured Dethiosulfovibrio sp.]
MAVYIIAEAGVNHNGSMEMALKLVDAAADAGADAVKFQTFKAEKLVKRDAPKAEYQIKTTGARESQFEMLRRLELSEDDHRRIQTACKDRGIDFLSTPFDQDSLSFLADNLGLKKIKLGSGEVTNGPLLLKAAKADLSVILSTGMSLLGEVEMALGCLAFGYMGLENPSKEGFVAAYSDPEGRSLLRDKVTVLHCTSEYPAPLEDVNLNCMVTMGKALGLSVGYSDHTQGISVPIAAVALGATVVEKHFTLDKNLPGPDHRASIDPGEMASMVKAIRDVELALGDGTKTVTPSERPNRLTVRKSLAFSSDLPYGSTIEERHLLPLRPGNGVSPMEMWDVLGRTTVKDVKAGDLL